jgi:mono/diheme cytochrome c family protein
MRYALNKIILLMADHYGGQAMNVTVSTISRAAASLVCLIVIGNTAMAQDAVVGQPEFKMHCAACHGMEGRGDGPIGPLLKTPAPNLALISERNGGKFPFQKVYEIIDGSTVLTAHGTRDMPLWGVRYRKEPKPVTPDQVSVTNEQVEQRILSLVYYLGTLQ